MDQRTKKGCVGKKEVEEDVEEEVEEEVEEVEEVEEEVVEEERLEVLPRQLL